MKTVLFFLLFPAFAIGQTVHIKEKKIVYEGKENSGRPGHAVTRAQLERIVGNAIEYPGLGEGSDSLELHGKMRMNTPYPLIRYVNYHFRLTPLNNGYKYVIDSVFYTEQERGRRIEIVPGEEMVERMGETGAIVGDTEKILNETDMRFQKLIAVLRSEMKKS